MIGSGIARALGGLAAFLLVVSPLPGGVAGAASPIAVQQEAARSAFPKEVDFSLQAQSSVEITGVRLAYQVANEPITRVAKATFSPGNRVAVSYKIDSTLEYYPPGTTIHYRWLIQDQAGDTLASAPADVTVVDGRVRWQSLTTGPVTLHWYEGDSQWVQSMAQAAAQVVNEAAAASGSSLRTCDVFLYGTESDFKEALGVTANDWTGGESFPEYGVALLYAPPDQTAIDQRSLAHELTHLVTDRGDDPFGPLPTWLDEGLSMVAEGQPDQAFTQALQDAVRNHQLLSIQSISGNFPEDTTQATLAYAESDSLVRYFESTYGDARLSSLIAAFRQGATSDQAFQRAIGMSTLAFQQKWEASIGAAPSAAPAPITGPAGSPGSSWLVRVLSFPASLLADLLRVAQQLGRLKGA